LKQAVTGRRAGHPARAQVMAARPVRNPVVNWERYLPPHAEEDSTPPEVVLLKVPRRADRWGNLVARFFKLPAHRKIELDEMGSDVWEMCDGAATVEALTKAVCAKYHLNRRQGEASVTAYLRMLAERRLIALRTASSGGGVSNKPPSAVASAGNMPHQSGRKRKNERSSRAASERQ
jgi:hypothetical protein